MVLGFGFPVVGLMGVLLYGLAVFGMELPMKIKMGMSVPLGFGLIIALTAFFQPAVLNHYF